MSIGTRIRFRCDVVAPSAEASGALRPFTAGMIAVTDRETAERLVAASAAEILPEVEEAPAPPVETPP